MADAADELPSGDDPSPNAVLTGTIGYLNADGTLGTLLQGAIFGTLVSVFTGGVNLIQSIFSLVVSPVDGLSEAIGTSIDATVIEPLGIIVETAQTSASSISAQFGPFAFLVGLGVTLIGFWGIIQFLEQNDTPDATVVPGAPDIPSIPFPGSDEGEIDVGVEEEEDEE